MTDSGGRVCRWAAACCLVLTLSAALPAAASAGSVDTVDAVDAVDSVEGRFEAIWVLAGIAVLALLAGTGLLLWLRHRRKRGGGGSRPE